MILLKFYQNHLSFRSRANVRQALIRAGLESFFKALTGIQKIETLLKGLHSLFLVWNL